MILPHNVYEWILPFGQKLRNRSNNFGRAFKDPQLVPGSCDRNIEMLWYDLLEFQNNVQVPTKYLEFRTKQLGQLARIRVAIYQG